jgi:hypothetical protein
MTGGQDACFDLVTAYVVPLSTDPASIQAAGGSSLPASLDQVSIAHTSASRTSTVTMMFAGRVWQVRITGDCVWGAGPNHFSGDNAWIDTQGRLHLKISYVNGAWRCAEIISTESLGYGTYTFRLASDPSGLPDPIVFGAFTYSDDREYTHREIDLEFSNGAVVGAPESWQFVIQPYTEKDHRHRFSAPDNMTSSMHVFTWSEGLVSFKSFVGQPTIGPRQFVLAYEIQRSRIGTLGFNSPPIGADLIGMFRVSSPTNIAVWDTSDYANWNIFYRGYLESMYETGDPAPFEAWSTQSNVPLAGTEKVHFVMWLFQDQAPGLESESYEIVVKDFEFKPETIDQAMLQPRLELRKVEPERKEIHLFYPAK